MLVTPKPESTLPMKAPMFTSVISRIAVLILLFSLSSFAGLDQTAGSDVEMADTMRSNGKIYVLVAVMLILLAGLVTYLVIVDRKVSRLEKRLDDNA